jgi:TIGR03009 family protein
MLAIAAGNAGLHAWGQQGPVQGPRPPADYDSRRPASTPSEGSRPAASGADRAPAAEAPPPGFRLDARQQKWVDQVLAYWEHRTSKIKTYRCDFRRWEYDPVFGPKDPTQAKSISEGRIRYASPDKGLIQVTKTLHFDGEKAQQGDSSPYAVREGDVGEHWVCDGQSVFEFDQHRKMLIETQLPPDMQGSAISESPLPFLFGAKAETIQRRYWVRELPSEGDAPKYYQIEAVPKGRDDTANLRMVQIFLDRQEFLPVGMQIYELNGQSRSSYQFFNRKENAVTDNVKDFLNLFVSPKPPAGWQKITHRLGQPAEPGSANRVPVGNAQRPVSNDGQRR